MEESGVDSKSARGVNSMNVQRPGTYLTPLCSWEAAEQCPIDRNGMGYLVMEESGVESESIRESPSPYG